MRRTPGWTLIPACCAPVLMLASWPVAQRWEDPSYDPVNQTISVLAAHGAPGYWLMTGALLALGACYVAVAAGLRSAAGPGRLALAGGGVAAMSLTLVPAPASGGSLGHGALATAGVTFLALWPALAADRGAGRVAWALRPRVGARVTLTMVLLALASVYSLRSGPAPGVLERILTFVQAVWPLVATLSCVGLLPGRRPPARDCGHGRDD